jgi:DNA polymerase-3 subunit beta
VALRVKDDKLILESSDLKRHITTKIDAEVEEDGGVTLPANKMIQLLTKYDGDVVAFESEEGRVKVRCGKRRGNWVSLPIADFPTKQRFDAIYSFKVKSKHLISGLQKTIFSSSKDNVQAVLQSVMVEVGEGKFQCVSSDGRRISIVKNDMELQGEKRQFLIPNKTAVELNRILDDTEEYVEFKVCDEWFDVVMGDTVLTSNVVMEKYVDFDKAIPESSSISVDINRKEFLNAMEIIVVALENDKQPVYFILGDNKIKLTVNSNSATQDDEINVEYTGEEVKMCFSSCFFIEALKVMTVDTFTFKCNGSGNTILISDNDDFDYVFMPMRERG